MDPTHKLLLQRNAVLLTDELEVSDDFLSLFAANRVISNSNREELLLPMKTSKRRSSEFQLMVTRKGPSAFSTLIQALVKTNQCHIADVLDPHLSARFKQQYGVEDTGFHMQETTPPAGAHQASPFFGPSTAVPHDNDNASIMQLNVQPVAPDRVKHHMEGVHRETIYDIKHYPRGNFVVINNEYFHKKTDREGSKFDLINLCELAKKLEFNDVTKRKDVAYTNLGGEDIKREMKALSKQDYSDHDALIISIMSHGANGIVYGVDGVPVDIEADICAPFDGNNCRTLSGKPKIFIIQACQGDSAVTGVPQADTDEGDAKREDLDVAFQNLRLGDTIGAMPIKFNHKISHKSDMIVAYSTVKGYKSWRRPDLGSWFIRAVVNVFSQYAHEEDIQSLFTMVKNKVSEEKTNYAAGDEYIQMPRTDDTLRKKWYFLPGYRQNLKVSNA